MTMLLVRHGETLWNSVGRFQGRMDSPLTARGRAQATALGRLLSREIGQEHAPPRTYVSPLGRTRETADIIESYVALDRVDEPRLAEVSVGAWDGLTLYEIGMEAPGALDGTTPFDWFFRSPDGETFDAACERVADWLREAQRPCIAISHGLTGRLVRGVHLGLSRAEMLALPVPQDGYFKLGAGTAERIA